MKELIYTKDAPAPIGPYSQAVAAGNMIFVSGQIPFTPEGKLAGENISVQTMQSIENLKAILEEAGFSLNDVVKTTVYLKDMNQFAEMNKVYDDYFGGSKPARAAVEVCRLPKDVMVEIDAIAVRQ